MLFSLKKKPSTIHVETEEKILSSIEINDFQILNNNSLLLHGVELLPMTCYCYLLSALF